MWSADSTVSDRHLLIKGSCGNMRDDALKVVERGIISAIPYEAAKELVRLDADRLIVGDKVVDLDGINNIFVVGAGKASYAIVKAVEEVLGERIHSGFVAVKEEETQRLGNIEVFVSSHPIPDRRSIDAGERIYSILREAGSDDLVIAVITGGASSLLNLPPDGMEVKDIQEVFDALLKCGASISEINTVRRHLCELKGGNMVRLAQPALIVTLSLDTGSKDLAWPDMCLPDDTTFKDAIDVLKRYDLWNDVGASLKNHLTSGEMTGVGETVKNFSGYRHTLTYLTSPAVPCDAMAEKALELGYEPHILSVKLDGEAKDIGIALASIANEVGLRRRPFAPPCALISGGETTVTFYHGKRAGKGGPNQETALGFALQIDPKVEAVCVCVDSDGTDGPCEIAGGISDQTTMSRVEDADCSIIEYLENHDSAALLSKLEDVVITGHTGTNVMNLRVVLVGGGDENAQ